MKELNDVYKSIAFHKAGSYTYTLTEVTEDLEVLASWFLSEAPKVKHGNKSAAKRMRKYTKSLEYLGLIFRKLSVK